MSVSRSKAGQPFAIPAQKSLPETLAAGIERRIGAGEFKHFLPGTRMLSTLFGVSLPTVSRALRLLGDRGVIEVRQGAPTRILQTHSAGSRGTTVIGVLLSENLPAGVCWPQQQIAAQVQTMLLAKGLTPLLFSSRQKGAHSDRKWLETVTESARVDLWLLLSPTLEAQRFFYERALPVMVLGSAAPGLELPGIGIDQEAVAHHAAATLWRLGHRRVLCVRDEVDRMGEQILLERFAERLERLSGGEAVTRVIRSPHDRDATARALERALRFGGGRGGRSRESEITACFFTHASTALSASTYLVSTGRSVPERLSLLSAQYADFLLQVHPAVASYHLNLDRLRKRLLRRIGQYLNGETPRSGPMELLIPELKGGESLAAAVTDQRG